MEKVKILARGKDARKKIRRAVNEVADTVRVTLGPGGRNSLIDRDWRTPRITNDGVFIAGNIEPDDELEAVATKAFVQAAKNTNVKAGDGTTSSVVLAADIINKCFDELGESDIDLIEGIGAKKNAMQMKRDIEAAAKQVIEKVKEQSRPVKGTADLVDVATVSMEDPHWGKIVAEMVEKIGTDGYVDVVEGFHGVVETEVVEGMKIKGKAPAPFLINNPNRNVSEVTDTNILVTNHKLDNPNEFITAFNSCSKGGAAKLVILTPNVTEDILGLSAQILQKGYPLFIYKYPSLTTEEIEDVAVYCGAKFINKNEGDILAAVKKDDLGMVQKVVASEDEGIMLIGGAGDTTERVKELKGQMEVEKDQTFKNKYKRRIGTLAKGIGIIRAGAPTEVDAGYLKLKFEDAVNATQAALEEGVVTGGGMCLKKIAEELPESIITESLKAPYGQICENLGDKPKITKHIIDPTKVVRLVVENACSVAATMITTESVMAEKRPRSEYDGLVELGLQIQEIFEDPNNKNWARSRPKKKIGQDDD